MKVSAAGVLLAGCGVCILVILGCAKDKNAGVNRAVSLEKERIVFGGVKISAAGQQTMNAILRKYDKTLYKIQTYKEGKLTATTSTMSD